MCEGGLWQWSWEDRTYQHTGHKATLWLALARCHLSNTKRQSICAYACCLYTLCIMECFLCLSFFMIFCADHDQELLIIIWVWWMAIIFCIITKSPKIEAFLASGIEVMEVDSIKTVNDPRIQWFPVSHCFISFASCRRWSSSPPPCAVLGRCHTIALLAY